MAGKHLLKPAPPKRLQPDPEGPEKLLRQRRRIRTAAKLSRGAVFFLLAAIILLNLFTHVLQVVRYHGEGMEPGLEGGQILVLRKTRDVSPGEVIAFYYNNQILVRRVICSGGDQISVESDGRVFVNAAQLDEPYLTRPSIGQCNLSFPYHVPAGHVFVMGDNRAIAMDSRLAEIGPIPADRIIGTILLPF